MSDLLKEALKDEAMEEAAAAAVFEEDIIDDEPRTRFIAPDLSFLLAPTGAGSVEDYVDHPLNFDSTKSTGRILRGFTGLCGALDYALVDITLGVIEKVRERKPDNEQLNYGK